MALYSWVIDGAETGDRRYFDGEPPAPKSTGAAWLPVVAEHADPDAGQYLGPVETTVETERVLDYRPAVDKPLDTLKAEKRAAINAEYETRISSGFPIQGETLQVRNAEDKANWLTLMGVCQEAVVLGASNAPCAMPPRTTANGSIPCTYAECIQVLKDLRAWAAATMKQSWDLKDSVDDAPDAAAVAAIDPTVGWP